MRSVHAFPGRAVQPGRELIRAGTVAPVRDTVLQPDIPAPQAFGGHLGRGCQAIGSVAERVRSTVMVLERDVPSVIMTYRTGKSLRGPTPGVAGDATESVANAA